MYFSRQEPNPGSVANITLLLLQLAEMMFSSQYGVTSKKPGDAATPVGYVVFSRLLAIVETVRAGDPFVTMNARRLQSIAWAVLVLELLRFVIVAVARSVSTPAMPVDIKLNFSITPWLAVLLLFVLAGVFAQGARMRADLDGTV